MTGAPAVLLLHGVSSSATTWWRAAADLADLGWRVHAIDLLGHGTQAQACPPEHTLDDLAADAARAMEAAREPGSAPFDLVIGHSLGAIVALTLAESRPDLMRAVVAEDPPGLNGQSGGLTRGIADDIERGVARTQADAALQTSLMAKENPSWAGFDVLNDIENQLAMNVPAVTRFLRSTDWDLPGLVAGCPVPVHVIAATGSGTALTGADRQAVASQLPPGRFEEIASGHCVHRDRPGLWLQSVLGFAAAVGGHDR